MDTSNCQPEVPEVPDEKKTPKTTTISTIAVQSGKTRLVIALLQVRKEKKILNCMHRVIVFYLRKIQNIFNLLIVLVWSTFFKFFVLFCLCLETYN